MDLEHFRTSLLLGEEALCRLKESTVTIVGLGAVGGFALETVARSGVGHLRVVDFDRFEPSNLNRQILATTESVGRLKTQEAAARVRLIAPQAAVEIHTLFFSKEAAERVLEPSPHIVIDAIDSLEAKVDLIEACCQRNIPVLSSMGAALRTDPDAVTSGDLFKSSGCPMARKMRGLLRQRGITQPLFCVYSKQPPNKEALASLSESSPGSRRPLGSLTAIPALFGIRLGHEAVMRIAENRL